MRMELFYATNRKHKGDRWRPSAYGPDFSNDGAENLRFGRLTVEADEARVKQFLEKKHGDGEGLAHYLSGQAKRANIQAYSERIKSKIPDHHQADAVYGSLAMFKDLKAIMQDGCDMLSYIHGFNVAWNKAVGAALALQSMLNRRETQSQENRVQVELFSWPSDGMALPFVSYKSDRTDAKASGYAVGRAVLKLRDFLRSAASSEDGICGSDMHLLCHSMGNFVLQNALERIAEFNTGRNLTRLFEHVFLCSSDVDDDVLELEHPMGRLSQLCRDVTVYHNRDDRALNVSDYTKGNPERLGTTGVARLAVLHNKINQVDCTEKVHGFVEHSYYLWGPVAADIRQSIDNVPPDAERRSRQRNPNHTNNWTLV